MDDVSRRILHELQDPLNLIQGFGLEVTDALNAFDSLLSQQSGNLPPGFEQEAAAILENDLRQCTEYMIAAAQRMDAYLARLKRGGIQVELSRGGL